MIDITWAFFFFSSEGILFQAIRRYGVVCLQMLSAHTQTEDAFIFHNRTLFILNKFLYVFHHLLSSLEHKEYYKRRPVCYEFSERKQSVFHFYKVSE